MSIIKVHKIRGKKKDELVKLLQEQKSELASLEVAKETGGGTAKLRRIRVTTRNVARILTVIHQIQKQELRKLYAKTKYKPSDLRKQITRAVRRQLTKHERNLRTPKQEAKQHAFAARVFALKA